MLNCFQGSQRLIALGLVVSLMGCTHIGQNSADRTPATGDGTRQPAHGTPNPVSSSSPGRAMSFSVDKDGMLVPVTKDGIPFRSCGTLEKNKCGIFHDSIRLKSLDPIMIIDVEYERNPQCRSIMIIVKNRSYIYNDPTDPNCN